MSSPRVSVVIPVYNAQRYLDAALNSVLAQTFTDWEMVCINDGSTDDTSTILNSFSTKDDRIRVYHQPNHGVTATLNRGLTLANAPLVARMDADDIAMPDRFRKQVAFLAERPNCVAVGGAILKIDTDDDPLGVDSLPTDHDAIETALLERRTGLFHPTVLFRLAAVQAVGGYRPEHLAVEDHDLWLRLAMHGELANLRDVLLCYRLHPSSACWQRSATQRENMNNVLGEAYRARGRTVPSHLHLSPAIVRAPGGPGKWARMAARGYAPRTALKHLVRLWREPASNRYRLRMTFETILRILFSLPKLPSQTLPAVPSCK